jgi:hypothetical protein
MSLKELVYVAKLFRLEANAEGIRERYRRSFYVLEVVVEITGGYIRYCDPVR